MEVSCLGDTEGGRLGTIAEQEGADVNQCRLLQENGNILRELMAVNESAIVADILKAITASDRSVNLIIDEKEMEGLMCRLRAIKAVRNVDPVEMRSAFASADSCRSGTLYDANRENAETHKAEIASCEGGGRCLLCCSGVIRSF